MSRDLTKKQKGFVKDVIKTGNATQSALKNYDTIDYSTAGNIGSDNLKKPKIKKALELVLKQYEKELQDILKAMKKKNKNSEQYQVLVKAADTIQKQIQLLGGNPTENIKIAGCEITVRK